MKIRAVLALSLSLAGFISPAVEAASGRHRLVFPTSDARQKQVLHLQQFPLLQRQPAPFSFSVCACGEGLDPKAAPSHRTFGVELRINYMDGSCKWLMPKATFSPAETHVQTLSDVFVPTRPVSNVVFYCRLALKGSAVFEGISVDELPVDPPRGACSIREEGGLVVMENDFLRVGLDPSHGGTGVTFLDKRRKVDFASADQNFRMFMDRFRSGGKSWKRAYTAKIEKSSPEEVEASFRLTGPDGFQYVAIEKRFRLSRHASDVSVMYLFHNLPESMGELVLEPWFKNSLVPHGRQSQCQYWPTASGVKEFGGSSGDVWPDKVIGGWVAAGDGGSETMAAEFDYSHLASTYMWLGGRDQYTAEWMFQPVAVPAGESFKTVQSLYSLGGLGKPDWCENGIAAAFADDGELAVRMFSVKGFVLSAELQVAMRSGGVRKFAKTLKTGPDGVVAWPVDVSVKEAKAARLRLYSEKNLVFEADRLYIGGLAYSPKKSKVKPAELKPFALSVTDAVKSPATALARPYAGGAVKALFVVDIRQQREIVELMERMDLDPRTIRIGSNEHAGAWGMIEAFGAFSFADSNLSLAQELKDAVDVIVVSGRLWENLDKANRETILKRAAAGTGLVVIDNRNVIPKDFAEDAAGNDYLRQAIAKELLPFGADRVCASSKGASRAVFCDYRAFEGLTPFIPFDSVEPSFRYQDYSLGMLARALVWAAHKDLPRAPGLRRTEEWIEPQPGLKIGHVRYLSEKGVVDWECMVKREPKAEKIKSFRLASKETSVGAAVKGTLFVTGGRARVVLSDSFGRVLAVAEDVKESFSLPVPEAKSAALDVTAELCRDGKLVDRRQESVLCRLPLREEEFAFAVGVESVSARAKRYLLDFRMGLHRALGVNQLRFWRVEPEATSIAFARGGFGVDYPIGSLRIGSKTFPKEFAEPYARTKDRKYLCRKPCLNDPEWMANLSAKAAERIAATAKFSPVSYDCGDENSLTLWATPFDFCFSDHTLKAFREWLKTQYSDLRSLNAAWGTDFADWSAVVPDTTEEARARAKRTGRRAYGAWADHRRFMELAFTGFYARLKEIMAEKCPGVPLDMSGTQQPNGWTGMDMWLIGKVIDIPAAYDHCELAEIVRSFGRPLVKPWYGYGHTGASQRFRVWHDAFRFQRFGISFYSGNSILMPDYTVPKQVEDIVDALKDLRDGGARLLRSLEVDPELLVHYSQASIHAAQIEEFYPEFVAERERLVKRLNAAGTSYRFVSYAEIEDGLLERTTAKTVVLPRSVALSDRECAALRRFSAQGGKVVGDTTSGDMDEHCRLRERNLISGIVSAEFDFGADPRDGIRPFRFRSRRGLGGMYCGFVRSVDAQGSGSRSVRLGEAAHVYDMRSKKYMGHVQGFSFALAPSRAAFFAALPYELRNVSVSVRPHAAPGETAAVDVMLSASAPVSTLHPVKVDVYDPAGRLQPLYSGVVETSDGCCRHSFRFALNDPAGTWRIVATDFVSGKSAAEALELTGPDSENKR